MTTQPATVHPAFEWKRSALISSLNINIEEYQHRKTGATHYHLASENPENVFLVALRTVPTDSTGVAHILEHTVLCGSQRYPVRDPFFMMIRRSLNTFMNAFTSSDWTAYPFASQNRKDFDNLLDVYLDAVFFSNLNELDFLQEGHRLEFEKADDPNSPLTFKGVVFNEMKGAMGSTVSTLWQELTKHLFPTTTYHYNSGGDPEQITDLSYQELLAFYRTHYHPSNAIFMTYGDIPANQHHERFEALALSKFDKLDVTIEVKNEKRYHAPVKIEEYYALDEEGETENKSHIVMGWLLGSSTDLIDQFRANLLSGVLLDNSSSPLRKALETTDLGTAPSPLCGVEDSNREMSFICGIEGSKSENAAACEKLVFDVLEDVAKNGVALEEMEAVLHQLELDQREVGGGSYPYGLQLILEGLPAAVHRGDPVAVLDLDPVLVQLRKDIKDPEFIKSLVRELLIDNQHRVRLTMNPDAKLSERRDQAETDTLAAIKQLLTDERKQKIIDMAKRLAERQRQQDDEDILPKVGLEDVPASMHIASGIRDSSGAIPLSRYHEGTNGLVYQQIVIELPKLDDDLLLVLPYYSSMLAELGCGERDYLQMQSWQAKVCGGINAYTTIRGNTDDVQSTTGYFFLSSKALTRNQQQLTDLLHTTLHDVRFDEHNRIKELMAQLRAQREQSVVGNGHGLAMLAASSGFCPSAALRNRLSGLQGIRHIKQLDSQLSKANELADFAGKLQAIHQAILAAPKQFVLVGEEEKMPDYHQSLTSTWNKNGVQTTSGFEGFRLNPVHEQVQQMWLASTPVNFCSKAYATVPMQHEDSPALSVLGGFLRNGYLHRTIRETGGAYGGGASYQSDIATFRFYSYRDPRLSETLQDFDNSIQWLLTEKHEWSQVEEAILGVIGSIDKPGSPAGEAKDAFQNELFGRTPELRQDYRARILKVTLDDLKRVGEKYLSGNNASTAVITNAMTRDEIGDLGLQIFTV